jgi:UDP-N-acetylglucosamine--N-acetylmuramyl-(pentapeptide) pyrophosphoryl-undecaprenol N-acetylglucosamine transferase
VLLISSKEVDRQVVGASCEVEVATLPAVALDRGSGRRFLRGFWQSLRVSRELFCRQPPAAVLAMGGFTSAPPVWAGKRLGAATFLHEGNAMPGRANRWLAHVVDRAFVHFLEASGRLWHRDVQVTGMPVRTALLGVDPVACRLALGLRPERPVLLVVGGSQGARGINELVTRLLPALAAVEPELQLVHLTGPHDIGVVRQAYASYPCRAVVRPFLTEMELALGAATVAISRAGASALAEFAALRLPAVLIPYPAAADNHQFHNARAFASSGAARLLPQAGATPASLLGQVRELLHTEATRQAMKAALGRWHRPDAAERIAEAMLKVVSERLPMRGASAGTSRHSACLPALKPADSRPSS